MELTISGLRLHEALQIVQADVYLKIDEEVLIDEPMCIDVGLPSLLLSGLEDISPNPWAPIDQWYRMPFFVCGCGDPECRLNAFKVRHVDREQQKTILLTEVECKQDGSYRELSEYEVSLEEYRRSLRTVAREFLNYIQAHEYRPLYADTLPTLMTLADRLEQIE